MKTLKVIKISYIPDSHTYSLEKETVKQNLKTMEKLLNIILESAREQQNIPPHLEFSLIMETVYKKMGFPVEMERIG